MGGREDVFGVSSWEVGTRSSSSASGRKREKGGEGEERGKRGEESHLMHVHGHITLHMHLTGPLAFWSEFA